MSEPSSQRGRYARLVDALPSVVPFVPPEALERRIGAKLRLRIGANESNFGPSPRAVAAMAAAAAQVNWYCDPEGFALREALAARHGVARGNIVLGSGIDDLLGLIVRAVIDPGDAVVMSHGAYPTFAFHVNGFGGRLTTVPYRDDRNDAAALVAAARQSGARLLYLSNPDNPTGSWLAAADQASLIAALPAGCLLVLDEAYADFAPAGALPETDPEDPRLIRLRTFSKAHGMAGARIGYAIAPQETIASFDKMRARSPRSPIAIISPGWCARSRPGGATMPGSPAGSISRRCNRRPISSPSIAARPSAPRRCSPPCSSASASSSAWPASRRSTAASG